MRNLQEKRMANNINKSQGATLSDGNVLVAFGSNFNIKKLDIKRFDTVVADSAHRNVIEKSGCTFVDIGTLVGPGSIEEANIFLDEISSTTFPNGQKISKSFMFEGYELWWVHYNDFFHYFSLPFTQYKKLLEFLRNFENVSFHNPPFKNLFWHYLHAYECRVSILGEPWFRKIPTVPLGILAQTVITIFSVLVLTVTRPKVMVSTGDGLEPSRDYDFRMKFIYEELRHKKLSFVEFIRSLESWKTVVEHAIIRRRPVVYSEAVAFIGKLLSVASWKRYDISQESGKKDYLRSMGPEDKFRLLVATHYLVGVYGDIWAVRIMRRILHLIGVRAAFLSAVTERNFSIFLGCKMDNIPSVGISHGVAFRSATPYDFMNGYSGEKMLSVDVYGVWSEWWKEYYRKYSYVYKSEQLYVSGPMRPLELLKEPAEKISDNERVRILFVSEQVAVPGEIMPYLRELLVMPNIELTIKFRPSRDGFEDWLTKNEPLILKNPQLQIMRGSMQDAIQNVDVVIGSYSTGVLEALLLLKIPIFLRTKKWGDYFSLTEDDETRCLFAENPQELKERIKNAHTLSKKLLIELREQYFGNPHNNGSKWVVEKLEETLITNQ